MTTLHHRPSRRQHQAYGTSIPRRGSASSFSSEDDITPCPLEKQQTREAQTARHNTSSSSSSSSSASSMSPLHTKPSRPKSWRSSQQHLNPLGSMCSDNETDTAVLWKSMLAIQREFGCYNSARMRAAVEIGGDDGDVRELPLSRRALPLE